MESEPQKEEIKKEIPQPKHKIRSFIPFDHIVIQKVDADTGEPLEKPLQGVVLQKIEPNKRVNVILGVESPKEGIPRFTSSPVSGIFYMSDMSYWVQTGKHTYRVTAATNGPTAVASGEKKEKGKESSPSKKTTQWTLTALLKLLGLKS